MTILQKIRLFIWFTLTASVAQAQIDSCSCAIQNSIDIDTYSQFFSPTVLSRKGIKKAVLCSVNASDTTSEIVVHFDDHGHFTKVQELFRDTVSRHTKFERSPDGKITKETFAYLNREGGEDMREITDYRYDSKGRLIEKRKRDYDGKIVVGNRANFEQYSYNSNNQVSKEIINMYGEDFGVVTYMNNTEFRGNFTSIKKQSEKGKVFGTITTAFNPAGKPLHIVHYNDALQGRAFEISYKYDIENRLISIVQRVGRGGASECYDGGSYSNRYTYKVDVLVDIDHWFRSTRCKVIILYNVERVIIKKGGN